MALNAAVTADGGEIGRAQAAQAEAAGIEPTVDMNPILLKPEADDRSQVVVRGTAGRPASPSREYERVQAALLARRGARASSALRARATMSSSSRARAARPRSTCATATSSTCASRGWPRRRCCWSATSTAAASSRRFVGTLALLPGEDRARVAGFVVNKFRGDATLLAPGLDELTARTGVPVLGRRPVHRRVGLVPAEDSLDLDEPRARRRRRRSLDIAVVRLPRIANFDDFEPLAREPACACASCARRRARTAPT